MTGRFWFIVGSQHLYGPEALAEVARNARTVADGLNQSGRLPVAVECRDICTTSDEVTAVCRAAAADDTCLGVIVWMHTFSPAKMWLTGLQALAKPLLHLHTQLEAAVPWPSIDMDFMNLHQSAHGGREFGHACARVGLARRVVVGHWQTDRVLDEVALWMRAAIGKAALAATKVARFGDNMRHVAVTDGDKVAAQMTFGTQVDYYAIGDLVQAIGDVSGAAIAETVAAIEADYALAPELQAGGARRYQLETEARIECGLREFLRSGGYTAFTDTFEDLHGLPQLPGLAVQRLMADGFGFGAEGDWKTAALLRAAKVMATGLPGGTSFMEDYTYDLAEGAMGVLGAHMLEVCPSISAERPQVECHPLGIGGKDDPLRLVFTAAAGAAVNLSLIDLGDRFRLVINPVTAETPPAHAPNLPVARAWWQPLPDLPTAAAAWIYAGGAHHTVFSQALTAEHAGELAAMCGWETAVIDGQTDLARLRQQLQAS